jgi:hypothetical protein
MTVIRPWTWARTFSGMQIWLPYYPAGLTNRKPEHKFPEKINMQRRLHRIPVKSTPVEVFSMIIG